jgi:hypothetical protein
MAFNEDMSKADRIVNLIIKVTAFLETTVTALIKLPRCVRKEPEKNS